MFFHRTACVRIVAKPPDAPRLKRLIQVGVHAWQELKINKVPQPSIRWIMNQEADQNPQHHHEAFQKMFDELKEVFDSNELESLRDVLKLGDPSIAVVPNMYAESNFVTNAEPSQFTRLNPAEEFSQTCANLTGQTVHAFRKGQTQRKFDNAEGWLQMSVAIFETILSYPNLTSLSDIKQRQQKKYMQSWINKQMHEIFWDESAKEKHREIRSSIWEQCKQKGLTLDEASIRQKFTEAVGDLEERLQRQMNKRQESLDTSILLQ